MRSPNIKKLVMIKDRTMIGKIHSIREPRKYENPNGKANVQIAINTIKPIYLSIKIDARLRLPFLVI